MTRILHVGKWSIIKALCVQVSATSCEFGKVTFSNLRRSIAKVYFHPKFWIMPPPLIEISLNDILARARVHTHTHTHTAKDTS